MFSRAAILLAGLLVTAAAPARANDSIAQLGTGGLILSRTDAVAMESEALFISAERVTVDYVFRNNTDEDVDTIVAFPMPDLAGNPYEIPSIPNDAGDNFLGFEVSVDGKDVKPELEQRAFAVGIDVTSDLKARGVPLYPFGRAALAALEKLPDVVAAQWIDRGIIIIDSYDDGSGWKDVRTPFWALKSTYWWRMSFAAGKPVEISHRYLPSVGGTAGLSFIEDGKLQGEQYRGYKTRYCMDQAFERAVLKTVRAGSDDYPPLYESRISYVLTTGSNWATGSIGKFRLTIDKGKPGNLVSFCGENVRKVGPTTFEMTADDYYPLRDLEILVLQKVEPDGGQ